ncbi:transcriptional repressor general negative regulator of transcription subunit 4 [Coemansia thaxteri]|nr:transcriptional repressor general negative regulator of transcription subunit 4 [Coemansia thaxteri]KAJ2474516.1 transcriptional repressor general negative regulator of transcription subunit 4 [Coemansia sp. RSA 2322]
MSSSDSDDWECPLCMEEMDIDDRGFFPCECGYQICRFCHNRISEDYGGRCPACRRLYAEQTPRWKPISPAQVAKLKNEKKAKEREKREIESNNRRHLANVRVVQKNLVYVIGLPTNLAADDVQTLRGQEYFGQFGRINKIVINRRQTGGSSQQPSVGVYVTYASKEEATRAINAVDGSTLDGRVLRATFGTTKYCSYYLRSIPCQNPGCMYLHEPGEEADSFTKEDLAANRAELRDGHRDAFEHDDDIATGHATSQSPNSHAGAGRGSVATGSLAGFPGNRLPSTVSAAPATTHASSAVALTSAAARLRKSSELSGLRPRSVEPHSNDGDGGTGSALPATASWASRAMAKKAANEVPEVKPHRAEGGGTMTLRMIPSSRSKTASASTNTATKHGSASAVTGSNTSPIVSTPQLASTRERVKSAAAVATGTPETALAGTQHHPTLQQLTRERKQQLRHQTRLQQKQSKLADVDNDGDGDTENEVDVVSDSKRRPTGVPPATAAKSTPKAAAPEAPELPADKAVKVRAEAGVASTSTALGAEEVTEAAQELDTAAMPLGDKEESGGALLDADLRAAQQELSGANVPADNEFSGNGEVSLPTGIEVASSGHASSALSFQSITDSLFAQLNAKVSTPPNTTLPAFSGSMSGAGGFDSHYGVNRSAGGYPMSAADPLLFPAMGGSDASSAAGYGRVDGTSQFSMFGGQAGAQWGERLGMAPGGYAPTPLSSVIGGSSAGFAAPVGGGAIGEGPAGGGMGAFSRQRSRWDFVHADEASAQAELQSVLGRGAGDRSMQALGPPAGSFASSRDLGMFSTPVQHDYLGRQWGGGQQADGYMLPYPPPGFGGRQQQQHTDFMSVAEPPNSQAALGASTPPVGAIGTGALNGGGGTSNLLSRLMGGQATSNGLDMPGVSAELAFPTSNYPQSMSQHQQYPDQAILSSFMAPGAGSGISPTGLASASAMQSMASNNIMQQQQTHGRGDPNVISSLLSRLHLGSGEGSDAYPLAPPGIGPMGAAESLAYGDHGGMLAQSHLPQYQHGLSGASGSGFADPAIMNMGRRNVVGGSGPTSPVAGPPPGILSPQLAEGGGGYPGQPLAAAMVSRSANSSGRSRFLNHFAADGSAPQQQRPAPRTGSSTQSPGGERSDDGDPPRLPTTGLFGELLRRAKLDAAAADGGAPVAGSTYVSGKMMLSDIERKLDAARREARDLQAQLSTVIGQNQSALWALANGGASPTGGA